MNIYQNNELFIKIDEFIRKYYKNLLIKGVIYFLILFLVFFLSLTLIEAYAYFSTSVRRILFFVFLAFTSFITIRFLIIPISKLYQFGKIISYEQAANIIGKHFTDVQDKLLNAIQLTQLQAKNPDNSLLAASIAQKTAQLRPIPFSAAINLKENLKYTKYLVLPLVVLASILLISPSLITKSTERLINYTVAYEKPAPFKFSISNKDLTTFTKQDFEIKINVEGNELPNEVYVLVGQYKYKANKINNNEFSYVFKNIQQTFDFQLQGNKYRSAIFTIQAIEKPILLDFKTLLVYPAYLNKPSETLTNVGDLVVPIGTTITWDINTQNTDVLKVKLLDSIYQISPKGKQHFVITQRMLKNTSYTLFPANQKITNKDSILYNINVIPDLYPQIQVNDQQDSLNSKVFYFFGNIKDDYGFNYLNFVYKKEQDKTTQTVNIPINKQITSNDFVFMFDFSKLNIDPGESIEYYFEVADNDGVNGSKKTQSQKKLFKQLTLQELTQKVEQSNQAIQSKLTSGISKAKQLQKTMNALKNDFIQKKQLGWQEQQKIKDALQQQKELEKLIEDIKNENKKNNLLQNDQKNTDPELLEKQKLLEQLFNELLSEDMKEMIRELQKMMDNMDKQKIQEMIKKMELSSKELNQQLDRSLELFKQLAFEQKLMDTKDKLDKLAKEQEKLSEKTINKELDNNTIKEQQDKLNKNFKELKKDFETLEQQNQALENPTNFNNPKEEQENIEQNMEKSAQQIQQNNNKKASESQKKAAQGMQELSKKMDELITQMKQEAQEENIETLKLILNNLLKLSFSQEELMEKLKNTNTNSDSYTQIIRQQQKLKNDTKVIEDSLIALSKRVIELKTVITKEINQINKNMDLAIEEMAERQTMQARSRQQYAMTATNNLALMLSEVLEAMQNEQMQMKMGMGSCNKPKSKNKRMSIGKMRQTQQKLAEDLKKMMEEMKNDGKQPNGQKTGNQGSQMSKELARMAAQQEALRNELQKIRKDLEQKQKGSGNKLGEIANQMEEIEKDIVNKRITNETLKRQQDILTRLLEAENAERERHEDEERESKNPTDSTTLNPSQLANYFKEKQKQVELLKNITPNLTPYYKNKVNLYFNNHAN